MIHDRDTIFALSSGRPPAAVAVMRISGSRARNAVETLAGRLPEPRRASLARLCTKDGAALDDALVLWFPGPKSETGEDMAELQLHGGRAVIAAVLAALGELDGLRLAEAGEFTRRSFENGRIDLTGVEGLADLIFAETQAQARQALRQLQGGLAVRAESWRAGIVTALARVEAGIDFSDQDDVPEEARAPAQALARQVRDDMAAALGDARRGERLRDGLVVAIAGPPNAGKSSLLNRLARREAAIVSPYPGTTRDVIEVHLDLGGYPVTVIDTAGVRDTGDPVEIEGVRRARERAAAADLVLWVTEAITEAGVSQRNESRTEIWEVYNKADLLDSSIPCRAAQRGGWLVSALTGEGLPALEAALGDYAERLLGGSEPALVTRARQREAIASAAAALTRALEAAEDDILAEELRLAARAVGWLTGKVDVEDVLDVIFRDFCIGK